MKKTELEEKIKEILEPYIQENNFREFNVDLILKKENETNGRIVELIGVRINEIEIKRSDNQQK